MFRVLKIPADSVHTARRGGALLRDSFVNWVLQSTTAHDGLLHPHLRHLLVASICRVAGNTAPQYMTDCCIHSSDIARRQHLRSAGCHQLFVPRHRRSVFGRRAFSVAGPVAWNSDYLRDPSLRGPIFDSFRRDLKTFFSRFTSIHSALEALPLCAV